MARKRQQYYRCSRCHSPVLRQYNLCGTCGHDQTTIVVNTIDDLYREYEQAISVARRDRVRHLDRG